MQHAARFKGGIVHYSTTDAIFRTLDGRPIAMEFHAFCGPFFSLEENDGGWLPEEDTEEWENLWDQFYGWAKHKLKNGKVVL